MKLGSESKCWMSRQDFEALQPSDTTPCSKVWPSEKREPLLAGSLFCDQVLNQNSVRSLEDHRIVRIVAVISRVL